MTDINTVLEQNRFAVSELLRRSRIVGPPTMDSIQRAYKERGNDFMMKLLAVITPQNSNYTGTLQPIQPLSGAIPVNLDTNTLATPAASTLQSSNATWSFWEKLLSGITQTGQAIAQVKNDVSGQPAQQSQQQIQAAQQAQQNQKMLYLVAGGFALLIILILIFK